MLDDRYVAVSYDESSMSSLDHCDYETNHVERPERISSIIKHLQNSGIGDGKDSVLLWNKIYYVSCKEVPRNILQLCHTEDYLDTVAYWTAKIAKLNGSLSTNLKGKNNVKSTVLYPLDEDTYMTCQSERVANLAVGGMISLCDLIMDKKSSISKGFAIIRPPGHHATSDRMMGFCIYNNVAVATKYLMSHYTLKKVAIIDWDVHQGNGTQEIFNDDPNVCFISTHRYGKAKNGFYPYQGDVHEKDIRNNIINIPLESGFTSDDLIYSFDNVILPILNDFKPEFILISAGFDAALGDLLGGCKVKPYAYSYIVYKLCQFAQIHCHGRILLALEGGYEVSILSKCVEGIIKTIIEFEMGLKCTISSLFNGESEDYARVSDITSKNIIEAKYCKSAEVPKGNGNFAKSTSCVMQSTIRTCTKILNFLNLDIISGLDSLKINANNSKININWTEYTHKLSDNTLVLAGGHQNQWIISMNDKCKEVVKLCSRQEVEFYIWLYNSNNLKLNLISKETPNFKLDFGDGLEDACLSGLRFMDASSEVKEMTRYDDPVIIDRPSTNNNVVLDIIKFITECSATYQSSVFKHWELNSIHHAAIRIKNALYGMKSPCVMDLKMGTRLYGDDCTDLKVIEYKQKKARDRTCGSHGFHISGIFNWNRSKKAAKYLAHESVMTIKSDLEIIHAFKLYLMLAIDKDVICRIVDKLISRLNDLKIIFEKQTSLAFYGTSLLFVFDSIDEDIVSSANVYMIDLSHISYNVNRIDEGYLLGINSIIRLLNSTRADINNSM